MTLNNFVLAKSWQDLDDLPLSMSRLSLAKSQEPSSQLRSAYLHLGIVYVIWGSTYIAMRIAVYNNSGFQPFSVGASRLGTASALLFFWAWIRKVPLRLSRQDLWVNAISGVIIWVTGNGFVMWAEQWVEAGYASLIFSMVPIWTALMGHILDRQFPSARIIGAFVIAILGMIILGGPSLFHSKSSLLIPTLVILFGTFLWSISTHLQRRRPQTCSSFVSSAYQQLFGALGFLVMAFFTGESWPHPTLHAWAAWIYLLFFGSIISFHSYLVIVRDLPTTIAMTFAYVCPVLAVFFGAIFLHEPITPRKLLGMVLILSAVYAIFSDHRRTSTLSQFERRRP